MDDEHKAFLLNRFGLAEHEISNFVDTLRGALGMPEVGELSDKVSQSDDKDADLAARILKLEAEMDALRQPHGE